MGIEQLAMAAMGVGTVMDIQATRREGKDAQKALERSAAIDIQNAEATRRVSVSEAQLKNERGRRFIEAQKAEFAAANVRINVGDPLVIEKETRDLKTQDIGFVLERGREESDFLRSRAAISIAQGKAVKKKSKWDAISKGVSGFGSIAWMGYKEGLFSKDPVDLNQYEPVLKLKKKRRGGIA